MALSDDIRSAFSEHVYPGDHLLTRYGATVSPWNDAFPVLRGHAWDQVPIAEFLRCDTPFSDLTPESFYYYLPGFLLASLDPHQGLGCDLASSLSFYLSPGRVSQGRTFPEEIERYNRFIGMFTEQQKDVVIRVLREYESQGVMEEYEILPTIWRLSD